MARGERMREVTGRHWVESINGDSSLKLKREWHGEGKPERRWLDFIFPWCVCDWRGAQCSGDGQTGGDGAVIGRRKMMARWAFMGRVTEKPPGLVQGFRAERVQWAEMGQKAGRTGRYGGLCDE
jgi:hypothetical protein